MIYLRDDGTADLLRQEPLWLERVPQIVGRNKSAQFRQSDQLARVPELRRLVPAYKLQALLLVTEIAVVGLLFEPYQTLARTILALAQVGKDCRRVKIKLGGQLLANSANFGHDGIFPHLIIPP